MELIQQMSRLGGLLLLLRVSSAAMVGRTHGGGLENFRKVNGFVCSK
jgi:hypothetical protein